MDAIEVLRRNIPAAATAKAKTKEENTPVTREVSKESKAKGKSRGKRGKKDKKRDLPLIIGKTTNVGMILGAVVLGRAQVGMSNQLLISLPRRTNRGSIGSLDLNHLESPGLGFAGYQLQQY